MKFFNFSSKGKKNTVELLLVLAIIAIVFIISMFWSVKPDVYARDFLPYNTVFYYEVVDINDFDKQDNYNLFDYSVPREHLEKVSNILLEMQTKIESFIWFKLENDNVNSYLVNIDKYPDNLVENLQSIYPDLYYHRLGKDILLISESQDIVNSPSKQVIGRLNVNYTNKGTNIYFDLRYVPEFLQKLSEPLRNLVTQPDVFINLSSGDINLYQITNQDSQLTTRSVSNLYFNGRQPKNFDFAIGTSQNSTVDLKQFMSQSILLPIFDTLPYHNLNYNDLSAIFLSESIIWQRGESWLVAKSNDWQPVIDKFAKTFELEEEKSLLPDGTLYIEYVSSGSPTITMHQYKESEYWQIDSLYGWDVDSVYYLSNDQTMVEEIIDQNVTIAKLLASCNQSRDYFLSDFIILDTNKLPEGDFKQYLDSKNIKQLNMFGYFNTVSTGILLCR